MRQIPLLFLFIGFKCKVMKGISQADVFLLNSVQVYNFPVTLLITQKAFPWIIDWGSLEMWLIFANLAVPPNAQHCDKMLQEIILS